MRIQNLDAGRGIAAFIVLVYHIPMATGISFPSSIIPKIIFFPANFGEQSVYFFMMLSGYVLANAYQRIQNFHNKYTWLVWRCYRLLPVYYSALLIGLVFSNKKIRFSDLTHFYIFRNSTVYSGVNPPLWSLTVEIIISILALPLIRNLNKIQNRGLWAFSITLYAISYLIPAWGIKGLIRSLSMFVVGLIIFKNGGFRKKINKYLKIMAVLGVFILSIYTPKLLNLILIFPLALIMDLLLNHNHKLIQNPITKFLGKYSFSLYATHWIVLSSIYVFRFKTFMQVFCICILFSLITAFFFAKFIEFPFRRMARKTVNPIN